VPTSVPARPEGGDDLPPDPGVCCMHHHPPLTPAGFYRGRRSLLLALAVMFGFLAIAATAASSWLLLTWDEPIQRTVEGLRTPWLNSFFLAVSRLGSTVFVLAFAAMLVVVTWRRCRAVALAIVFATLARPLLESLLKELVGRSRPDLDRMVHGTGFSFPSGHVMASVALWGLVPLVVGLYTRRRAIWWVSVAISGLVIGLVGASRVYLGVHWFSDVTAGLVLGSFFLLTVEAVLELVHRRTGCGRDGSRIPRELARSRMG
jgi:membrane-associated phospholipid phosphatase